MVSGHVDQPFFYICATSQLTKTPTSHVIARYVPEINMPTKFGICATHAKYLMEIYWICTRMYVPHIKSLASMLYGGSINADTNNTNE